VGTIRPQADAKATLNITTLTLSVVKGFNPLTVFGGSSSTMSIQLINPNNAILSGLSFTDTMPEGMYVANPPNPSVGTCGGTLTAVPDSNSFTFSGGTLGANKRCTITMNVTMNVHGNRTNTIPAGGVTTFNGVSNTQAAQASLTNLPGVSISKFFSPNEVVAGETSLLTIRIKNTGNIALSNMNFTDNLPAGLLIDDSTESTNGCGGTLQATAGTSQIRLISGDIIAGPDTTCDIVVPIVGSAPGFYINTINKNNLTTAEGATNTEPASDTLNINATPDMQLSKSLNIALSSPPPYTLGETLAYTLIATNTGDVELTNVTIADSGGSVSDCTPALNSALAPGASMTCTATYTVIADDVTAGSYTNTATADSNETDEVTDTVTVPIDQTYALNISKVITTSGPYELGNTLNYSITVTNIGSGELTNVSVTDPGTGVTLGACTPAQPATLASGASMVCPASHVVVQADVNAGTFSNTATADSDETDPPVSDTVTVPIKQNARLQIFKQITSTGPYNTVGKHVTYDISAVNGGDQTLTGVTITDPGDGVTLGTCTPAQPATLTTGQILSCAAYHDITADDLTAGGYSNTAYADSDQTDPVSATAEVVSKTPTILLDKVGTLNLGANGRADAGDTISYAFTVTNTGEVTLEDVYLIDIVGGVTISGGPIESLASGASDSATFTGSYTLTQEDIDAGTFANIASAVGTPPVGSSVSDTDDDTQTFTAVPAVELTKTGTLDLDTVAPSGVANAGDKINYTFSVTNTGNVTLTNVTVSDTVGGITITGSPIASLAPGVTDNTSYTGTYTLTQDDVDAGTFTNTATVTGTPPTGDNVTDTDDDTQDLPPVPSISLIKEGTLDLGANSQADAGDQITYTFTVENTGNVTLSNITIDDIIPGVSITGGPISLAPGEKDEDTFTGAYSLTQDDVDNGSFANTATVTGKTPKDVDVTDTDDDTQSMEPAPSIELLKTGSIDMGSNGRVDAGETIEYVFTITNTGNVTLTNITLSDSDEDVIITGGPIATLVPGASNNHTFSGSYTLTQDDIDAGTYTNTATVTGETPTGGTVTDEDDDTQDLGADRSIQLEKVGTLNMDVVPPNDHADPGDTITYEFTITNIGNVTLTDVTVTDSTADVTLDGSIIASLAPGEEDDSTYTATYTITQDDVDLGTFTNEADVTAKAPTSEEVTDSDDDVQNLGDVPNIGLRKRVSETPTEDPENPGNWLVTFELLVRNLGNVTLTGIQVTDDLAAAFPAEDATFTVESLASDDLTVNPAYDGVLDLNLLDGSDSLAFEGQGTITLVVRVVPITGGPFNNSAEASGNPPTGDPVTATSHDDFDPDDPDDGTPFDFGPYLFDPPSVTKVVNASRLPRLRWKLVLINNSNIVNSIASLSDPIPKGSTYIATGAASGYDVPLDASVDSTNLGVSCTDTSDITETTLCYYEGPTEDYPRGRIVWEGVVGPDPGAKNATEAEHEMTIIFDVKAKSGVHQVRNRAVVSADLDGDGLIGADPEEGVVIVSRTWSNWPESLPETGFAPGQITILGEQPEMVYDSLGDLRLEIPDLGVNSSIIGVPIDDGLWNLNWLGSQVGYLEETAFPTRDGNSALTAHNYDANGLPGPFEKLENLTWGKQVIIHGWGKKYIYEVRSVDQWTAPDDVGVITHEETSWLTLITCRGYNEDSNSYNWRVVVRAVLVDVHDE
jgi:LPXTG-site transpeptidase (sortase) family protein